MIWQYKAVVARLKRTRGRACPEVVPEELTDQMNLFGCEGWELVGTFDILALGATQEVVLLFRRAQ